MRTPYLLLNCSVRLKLLFNTFINKLHDPGKVPCQGGLGQQMDSISFVNFLFCFCYFDLTWFISFDFHLFFDGGHEVA